MGGEACKSAGHTAVAHVVRALRGGILTPPHAPAHRVEPVRRRHGPDVFLL